MLPTVSILAGWAVLIHCGVHTLQTVWYKSWMVRAFAAPSTQSATMRARRVTPIHSRPSNSSEISGLRAILLMHENAICAWDITDESHEKGDWDEIPSLLILLTRLRHRNSIFPTFVPVAIVTTSCLEGGALPIVYKMGKLIRLELFSEKNQGHFSV